jgi:hypothetical protein
MAQERRAGEKKIIWRSELIREWFGGDEAKFRIFFSQGIIGPADIFPKKGKIEKEAGWHLENLGALADQLFYLDAQERVPKLFDLLEKYLRECPRLTRAQEIQRMYRRIMDLFPPWAVMHGHADVEFELASKKEKIKK